jgi:hypothetical protein
MPSCGCIPGGPYCAEARMLIEAYERAAERDDAEAAAALDAVRAHVPLLPLATEHDDLGDPTEAVYLRAGSIDPDTGHIVEPMRREDW